MRGVVPLQLLYCLDTNADSADDRPSPAPIRAEAEKLSHKSFLEIFGQRKRPNGKQVLVIMGGIWAL